MPIQILYAWSRARGPIYYFTMVSLSCLRCINSLLPRNRHFFLGGKDTPNNTAGSISCFWSKLEQGIRCSHAIFSLHVALPCSKELALMRNFADAWKVSVLSTAFQSLAALGASAFISCSIGTSLSLAFLPQRNK